MNAPTVIGLFCLGLIMMAFMLQKKDGSADEAIHEKVQQPISAVYVVVIVFVGIIVFAAMMSDGPAPSVGSGHLCGPGQLWEC